MIKKAIVLAIAVFLAVLFLSTIGSFYTGYAVLDQSSTFKNYPYPLVKNSVPNDVYIVVPDNLKSEYDKSASLIAQSLKGSNPIQPKVVTVNSLPEGDHNLILIGSPCNNKLIAKEMPLNSCDLGLSGGEGFLKLVNHEKYSIVIVSGDINKASNVLSRYNFYPLRGTEIRITGNKNLVLDYN